jgi:hypothetical protein
MCERKIPKCGKNTGRWFSLETPVSSTNKTDLHNITEILLKVVLNTMPLYLYKIIKKMN